jgi:O-antigen/teichoic acid export membrane protein
MQLATFPPHFVRALGQLKILSLLWVSTGIGAALAFLTQTFIARKLGPEDFGVFSGALTGMGLLVPIVGMGMGQFWLQIYGEEGDAAKRWMQASLRLLLCGFLLASFIAGLAALLSSQAGYPALVIVILFAHVVGQAANELAGSKHQMEGKFFRLANAQLMPHVTRFCLVFVAGLTSLTVNSAVSIYALVGCLMLAFASPQIAAALMGRLKPDRRHIAVVPSNSPSIGVAFSRSLPFGLAGFFHLVYFQSNIIALVLLKDSHSAGAYSAAFGIVVAIYLLPTVVYQKFLLPKLHRWRAHDKQMFSAAFKVGTLAMVVLGVGVSVLVWWCSGFLIPLLFGSKYFESIAILKMLSFSMPFMFLSHSSGSVLIGADTAKVKTAIMGAVAILNIVICALLIPSTGALGAALTSVVCNCLLAALYSAVAIVVMQRSKVIPPHVH